MTKDLPHKLHSRFLSRMCTFVHLKMNTTWKGFITLISFILFLTSMYFCMPVNITVICKGLSTLYKIKGFLSTVCYFMPLKMTVMWKGLTFVGFLSSVYSFVLLKIIRNKKVLPHWFYSNCFATVFVLWCGKVICQSVDFIG